MWQAISDIQQVFEGQVGITGHERLSEGKVGRKASVNADGHETCGSCGHNTASDGCNDNIKHSSR
jgi:hypothetical protein